MTTESRSALDDTTYHYGISNCLMNYEQGTGFYFLPCVGNHVPADRMGEDVYAHPMLPDQVTPVYPTGARNEFYYFTYDRVNNVLKNVQTRAHGSLTLRSTSGANRLMALPGMIPDKTWAEDVNKEVIWVGVRTYDNPGTGIKVKQLLWYDTSDTAPFHANNFSFEIYPDHDTPGKLKGLITTPMSLCCPNTSLWPKYRGCIGLQVYDGKVSFPSAVVYDNTYIHNYTSTSECENSVKILVLLKPDGGTGVASQPCVLNSSIEMAGLTITDACQINHTAWSVSNGVITEATPNEFQITKLDTQPIRVEDSFQIVSLSYPENTEWLLEFADKTSLFTMKGEATFTIDKASTIVNRDYTLAQSAEGLRVCYGKFFTGQSQPLSGLSTRIGVGCTLCGQTTVQAPDSSGTETLNCWQLVQSSLVIPFGCPRTWKAKQVKLDWSGWTGSATAGSKVFVWLARDQFIETHPEYLGKLQISTGGTVAGCELVGEIDPTSGTTNKTFNIQDLASSTATIILTAFMDMDNLNPGTSPLNNDNFHIGVGNLALNMMSKELTGIDTCMIPNIQLLG